MVYTTGEDIVSSGVDLLFYTTGGEFRGVHHRRGFLILWCTPLKQILIFVVDIVGSTSSRSKLSDDI